MVPHIIPVIININVTSFKFPVIRNIGNNTTNPPMLYVQRGGFFINLMIVIIIVYGMIVKAILSIANDIISITIELLMLVFKELPDMLRSGPIIVIARTLVKTNNKKCFRKPKIIFFILILYSK